MSHVAWKQGPSEVKKGDLQSQESYLGWLRGTDPKGPAGRGREPRPCGIPRLWCRAEAKAEVAGRLGVPSRTGKATWGPELGECVVLEMR